ncbi:MAG TPA: glycerol-3-phosphate dehydrogenase/oxidase [Roseiflexaceae bacterium]|nr:glycerol-3-phosphate dehydrogenase/oxidase [Roseiflexaceae bacterium]
MAEHIHSHARAEALESVRARPDVTVLIIGGGINGAGLFRELALHGVDVLLAEKSDFCAGASAASSHMIHGGLRYLENGEFRLVREALHERNLLLRNAAHYVRPLPTTIPIFSWTSGVLLAAQKFLRLVDRPGSRGALLVKAGLTLYDLFTRSQRVMPAHRFTSRAAALRRRPQLHPKIVCTATYYDAWITHPERLCLELIMDAEAAAPQARALNYLAAESVQGDTVRLRDRLTGAALEVRPRVVVNATGAWIDQTNGALCRRTDFIGGTKGSHLLIDSPELHRAVDGHMFFYENGDGRICIVFPYYDKVLLGSTDIYVDDPESVRCEDDEVAYMLDSLRQVFPDIAIAPEQIVFRYCGVRPLPRSDAATPGQVSRDYRCEVLPADNRRAFAIYSLIGGKWTTFRALSEHVGGRLLGDLGLPSRRSTTDLPIGGSRGYPDTPADRERWIAGLAGQTRLPVARVRTLLERYGTYAASVARHLALGPDAPLHNLPGYTRREIGFLAACEKVALLADLVLRRTTIAMQGLLTPELLEELADAAGDALGWTPAQRREQIERTAELLERAHGVQLASVAV